MKGNEAAVSERWRVRQPIRQILDSGPRKETDNHHLLYEVWLCPRKHPCTGGRCEAFVTHMTLTRSTHPELKFQVWGGARRCLMTHTSHRVSLGIGRPAAVRRRSTKFALYRTSGTGAGNRDKNHCHEDRQCRLQPHNRILLPSGAWRSDDPWSRSNEDGQLNGIFILSSCRRSMCVFSNRLPFPQEPTPCLDAIPPVQACGVILGHDKLISLRFAGLDFEKDVVCGDLPLCLIHS